jgi:hypothetical protein
VKTIADGTSVESLTAFSGSQPADSDGYLSGDPSVVLGKRQIGREAVT